ncbi:Uncharacterised protein [Chryseobacterium taklimakanense]|uniref:Uncharacterized protein n=1 Tax=Chryseobacterium taklimakanense TaxID=536441 RepID=A0A239XPN0_9FLAO|nr:Uncharacterised protein [Chryseobacterium taklimakanense]
MFYVVFWQCVGCDYIKKNLVVAIFFCFIPKATFDYGSKYDFLNVPILLC